MTDFPSLAFVDLETTGLSPTADRITEIGVVTADANEVTEWTTLLNPGKRISRRAESCDGTDEALLASAPSFKEIAPVLASKLAGRLFIAHNARFDYSFLKAAFDRVGIEFCPQVLCSVMLSRKLYAGPPHHDLDSLMERHGLQADMRHRALPDAQLLWQFWGAIHRDHSHEVITKTISTLLAGPVFPPHLDPSLVDRLPEAPGVYVLHGDGVVLHVGHAVNLRAHLRNYFRLDRSSAKALAVSHRVRNITWRVTAGALGARLQLSVLSKTPLPAKERQVCKGLYSWQLNPEEYPSVQLISVGQLHDFESESYGLYDSQRKARNDLRRLACEKRLCHFLLGIEEAEDEVCTACHLEDGHRRCSRRIERLKHLTRAVAALTSLRIEAWPFAGPIGIRERDDIHIIHDWRYLGTGRNEADIDEILQTRISDFDEDVYMLLAKKLPRLAPQRIIRFPEHMKHRGATEFEAA